jgi:XapX domain-containing protein
MRNGIHWSDVKAYLISGLIGLIVGCFYGGINVKSPAPPLVALLGLLGMVAGETLIQWFRNVS